MVNGIGGSGAGRAAIEAALKSMRSRTDEMGSSTSGSNAAAASESGFAEAMLKRVGSVESQVNQANEVHEAVVNGDLDLHEVAAQLKSAELTLQFSLTVRNKLMDAYREVMRMSV